MQGDDNVIHTMTTRNMNSVQQLLCYIIFHIILLSY